MIFQKKLGKNLLENDLGVRKNLQICSENINNQQAFDSHHCPPTTMA
jgi:hypothetical protein